MLRRARRAAATILELLTADSRLRSTRSAQKARGVHGALLALERDGLITLTRPLKGSADASRTVRVAR